MGDVSDGGSNGDGGSNVVMVTAIWGMMVAVVVVWIVVVITESESGVRGVDGGR
jgi:hypothetical protein